jgi:steroid 5-alpha reductase family enzyme
MMELLYYLGLSLLIQLVMFVPAYFFKTDKLTDLSYGATFIILSLLVFLLNPFSWAGFILLAMVAVWGVRLAGYLFIRINKMKKDERFDGIREKFFRFLSFWIIQGVSVWVILLPTMLFFGRQGASATMLFGFLLWLSGFTIEAVADLQKFRFYGDTTHRGEWISHGLWKYSRHPNYFGEILCWVGIYIYTFSFDVDSLIGLASPLFISFLIIFVSGIPKLEQGADKKWGMDARYQEYKRNTSVLVPFSRYGMKYLSLYLAGLLMILAIDFVWLGFVARNFYQAQFGSLMRQGNIPYWSAFLTWMLIVLGILLFVISRRLKSIRHSVLLGVILGLVVYGVYDFTNYATIQNWTLKMTFVDILWGMALSGLTTLFMSYLGRRVFKL